MLTSLALHGSVSCGAAAELYHVYFGTYTDGQSKGIYLAEFDAGTGTLGAPQLAAETRNPTFLALNSGGRMLYAANEVNDLGKKKSGGVSGFKIDPRSGALTFLNQEPSGGAGPCHLAVDRAGECVLVANYVSGSVAVLPLEADGRLRAPSDSVQHHGSSVNPQRQEGPHAHFVTWDPKNRHELSCDLGLDKVLIYQLERPALRLQPNDPPWFKLAPGSGPRHLAFHPNGHFAYVISEMGSTVTVCAYNGQRGELGELQTVSTLPAGFSGINTCAEIAVHPSGKYLFASNRGHDSIAVFTIDPGSGKLGFLQDQPTQGKTPRHFTLDPTSRWLLAENQDSGTVVVFGLDPNTGRLTPTNSMQRIGSPVCAVFLRKP